MERSRRKGALADALHALDCAAGHNMRWPLRAMAIKSARHAQASLLALPNLAARARAGAKTAFGLIEREGLRARQTANSSVRWEIQQMTVQLSLRVGRNGFFRKDEIPRSNGHLHSTTTHWTSTPKLVRGAGVGKRAKALFSLSLRITVTAKYRLAELT
jgi:hypothetical protein